MSNCTCGKTSRPPMCDGSHWLSDEEYKERTEKLAKLFNKSNTQNNKPKEENDVKRTV